MTLHLSCYTVVSSRKRLIFSQGVFATLGADPLIVGGLLANYGLALGLNGDAGQSQSVLKAAEFWAERRSHPQAVITFNRSLLALDRGDEEGGLDLMRKAFQMSKKEISRYASYSTIVSGLRKDNEGLHVLLDEIGLSGEGR